MPAKTCVTCSASRPGFAEPVQMSDALSHNTSALPEGVEIMLASCFGATFVEMLGRVYTR
jgi:hypothetical protein